MRGSGAGELAVASSLFASSGAGVALVLTSVFCCTGLDMTVCSTAFRDVEGR